MKEKSVKLQRTESLLKEVLSEALATLSDSRLNSLGVVEVECSKGKYHAEVYLDAPFANAQEKREILRQLRLAEGAIREHCLTASGWYKCPHFHFNFDDTIEKSARLEALFEQIAKERER